MAPTLYFPRLEFTIEATIGGPQGLYLNSSNLTILAKLTGAVKPLLLSNLLRSGNCKLPFSPTHFSKVKPWKGF